MEQRSGLQFTLFGIPVLIEPWFFVLSLFALQTRDVKGALIWGVLVLIGVMVHELGHAMAMRAYGFAPSIRLHALGGHTHYPTGARVTPKQSLFITLAGPMAGLTLGALAFVADRFVDSPNEYLSMAIGDAKWINIGWSIVNLMPILPWDGGTILDSGLHWASGKRRDRVVGAISMAGGAAIVAFAFSARSLMLGYFGGMGLYEGYRRWTIPANAAAAAAAPLRTDDDEKRLQLEVISTDDPQKRAGLNEQLAWVRLQKGDFTGARRAVNAMGAPASVSLQARLAATENDANKVIELLSPPGVATESDRPLLLSSFIAAERFAEAAALARAHVALAATASTRLFQAGAFAQSLELCTAERVRTGDGVHAYNEACCLCHLGRLEDAVTALQKAKALGYAGLGQVQTDEDLAPVRNRPEVQSLLS